MLRRMTNIIIHALEGNSIKYTSTCNDRLVFMGVAKDEVSSIRVMLKEVAASLFSDLNCNST